MDWQVLGVWLAVGGVVIWITARWFLRRVFRGRGEDDQDGGGKPPCCG